MLEACLQAYAEQIDCDMKDLYLRDIGVTWYLEIYEDYFVTFSLDSIRVAV